MKKWYADEKMAIMFSETPDADFREITPEMSDKEAEKIAEKPFLNKKTIEVHLWDHQKRKHYRFTIKKGYTWDGATIPSFCWMFVGAKTDPRFTIASMIHDVLCINKGYVQGDRYFATIVFDNCLKVAKVHPFKRWLMKHPMDNFQKIRHWEKWEEEDKKC